MILHGNTRGGAISLAKHLLKDENDHVTVHELRGFVADDLPSAFNEIHAVSLGTKAKKYMFSLSLNPPQDKDVSTADFEAAINDIEKEFGFEKQPRGVIFHEKNARRHAHVVWSRIDSDSMKAIKMDYYKNRLMDHSRSLYLKHGWQMPKGMMQSKERDPRNFTMAEWQQAKRAGKDVKAIKASIQDCWAASDNQVSLKQSLASHGYALAKGDKRIVVVDHRCEVYALSKYTGIKKEMSIRNKVNEPDNLPSVEEAKEKMASQMKNHLANLQHQQNHALQSRLDDIESSRKRLVRKQKEERQQLSKEQTEREQKESLERQEKYRKGILGLLDRFTGRHKAIKKINEDEAKLAMQRQQTERDQLIFEQMVERKKIEARTDRLNRFQESSYEQLNLEVLQYQDIQSLKRGKFEPQLTRDR